MVFSKLRLLLNVYRPANAESAANAIGTCSKYIIVQDFVKEFLGEIQADNSSARQYGIPKSGPKISGIFYPAVKYALILLSAEVILPV